MSYLLTLKPILFLIYTQEINVANINEMHYKFLFCDISMHINYLILVLFSIYFIWHLLILHTENFKFLSSLYYGIKD